MKKIITGLLVAVFLLIPIEPTHAAAGLKATANTTATSATVKWAKFPKATEYQVFIGGRKITTKSTKTSIPSLKAATKYKICIKAVGKKTVKKYYNSKTKKWQKKKPNKKAWKGKKQKKQTVKVTLAKKFLNVRTKEQKPKLASGSFSLNFASVSGVCANVKVILESGKYKYRLITDQNGNVEGRAPTGTYTVSIEDDIYSLDSPVTISISSAKKTTGVIDCEEKLSFLDVVVKADAEMAADVEIRNEEGTLISSSYDTQLSAGYNYPADAEVPEGEYTVTLTTDAETMQETVAVFEKAKVYSAYFEVSDTM